MSISLTSRLPAIVAAGLAVACAGGAVAVGTSGHGGATRTAAPSSASSNAALPGTGNDGAIARAQAQLRAVPGDWQTWASL